MFVIFDIVVSAMRFLTNIGYYILVTSYHIGHGLFWLLSKAFSLTAEIYEAVVIIGEEFSLFLISLGEDICTALSYARSSTNGGIEAAVEAVSLFYPHVMHFFVTTKVNSKLLATACVRFLVDGTYMVGGALLLIGDFVWWLSIFIPSTLWICFRAVSDFVMFIIYGVMVLLTNLVRGLKDDFFRYMIALLVLFLFFLNFWHLCRLLRKVFVEVVRISRTFLLSVLTALRLHVIRFSGGTESSSARSRMTLSSSSSLSHRIGGSISVGNHDDKLLETQRCVVCFDKAKCVLLLPCRHLCLCSDCSDYLLNESIRFRGRAPCPLCRVEVTQSMTVYV